MPAKLNIEGQKFSRLTALHDVGSDKQGCLWECLCDCGQFVIVHAKHLKCGNTKSCGCLQKEIIGDRYRLPTGEANLNCVIFGYKRRAKRKNLEFLLTKEQFRELTQQNCFYCGTKPHNIANWSSANGKYIYSGIDRIDNTKGYTVSNCVTCCFACNDWKKTYTQQEFLMRIKLIYENLLRKQNA